MPLALKLNRHKTSTFVGLDIQPGYVAAVQARVNGEIVVERAAGCPLPADTVREGEVLNQQALSDTLRELFDGSQLDRRVRVGIANQRTVLRMLELPPVTDRKELAAAVRFQAEDQVPMPLNNAVLDFQSLGVTDTPGGPRQRVVLVAAQRDMVERLVSAVREAGLRPEGVDLSAFAMIRSLYRPGAQEDEGRVLYLNVGGLTNMAIADGATCHFTRVVGGGLEAMAVEIAERREMSLEQARALLADAAVDPTLQQQAHQAPLVLVPNEDPERHYAESESNLGRPSTPTEWMPEADAEVSSNEHVGDQAVAESHQTSAEAPPERQQAVPSTKEFVDDSFADVRLILENGAREIAGEVRNSLDFHRSQEGGGTVTSVVLSGSALEIDGFAETLQNDLGLTVRCEVVRSVDEGSLMGVSPESLAIAAGLAVEEMNS
jgi:type IV pilus assembly protein PilM